MRSPEKRKAAVAGTTNGLEFPSASEGNPLGPIYPSFSRSATDFATAVIATRWHLPAPTARVVVELACLGGRT